MIYYEESDLLNCICGRATIDNIVKVTDKCVCNLKCNEGNF